PEAWGWRMLYAGRISPEKGVDVAVAALDALPEASLVLAGRGDTVPEHPRLTVTESAPDELASVYAAADCVLFPVVWPEPWGLVPLEAMSVGRPVIATGTGGSREYLRHELNCLLYEPRDSSQALADAVHRLAGDEALRLRIREHGFETASRYTERAYNEMI